MMGYARQIFILDFREFANGKLGANHHKQVVPWSALMKQLTAAQANTSNLLELKARRSRR